LNQGFKTSETQNSTLKTQNFLKGFKMISIEHKTETRRTARAQAIVKVSPATVRRLKRNDLPKKDVIPTARAAGLFAAKRTPDLLPDCHPLALESVQMNFEVKRDRIRIECRVVLTGKTGAEMEALTAVTVAALTVYDMLKPIDPKMEITDVKLLEKTGGKSDRRFTLPRSFKASVITVSDRTARGVYKDASGAILKDHLRSMGVKKISTHLLPDEKTRISSLLEKLCQESVDLILTTGGTGLSPRDVTVEAVKEIIEREIPGIGETARAYGQKRVSTAMLSRGIAGHRGKSLIVTLPGSPRAVREWIAALFPGILHAFDLLDPGRGPGH
jgi:molybdenum cofactor biosynthesis protein MoaC